MKTTYLKPYLLVLTLSAYPLFAGTLFTSDVKKGSVNFKAIGKPAFLKIEGKGEGPSGKLTAEGKKLSGDLTFNLNSLNTGIDLRDEHMKEKYLKTKENPTASLKLENAELSSSFEEVKALKGTSFKGKLTLNKVSKDITGEWDSKTENNLQLVTAKFSLKISDYGLEIPEYAGITVADEVKIEVTAALVADSVTPLAR